MKGLSQEEAAIANYIHSTIENIMAHTQQIPEGPLRDEPSNPRTRIVGMRWVELGKGKDPEFLDVVFLYRKMSIVINDDGTPTDDFQVGYLKGIDTNTTQSGIKKVYTFLVEQSQISDFTHYSIPQPPK